MKTSFVQFLLLPNSRWSHKLESKQEIDGGVLSPPFYKYHVFVVVVVVVFVVVVVVVVVFVVVVVVVYYVLWWFNHLKSRLSIFEKKSQTDRRTDRKAGGHDLSESWVVNSNKFDRVQTTDAFLRSERSVSELPSFIFLMRFCSKSARKSYFSEIQLLCLCDRRTDQRTDGPTLFKRCENAS